MRDCSPDNTESTESTNSNDDNDNDNDNDNDSDDNEDEEYESYSSSESESENADDEEIAAFNQRASERNAELLTHVRTFEDIANSKNHGGGVQPMDAVQRVHQEMDYAEQKEQRALFYQVCVVIAICGGIGLLVIGSIYF